MASSSRNTPLILQRVGLDTWFDAVIDGNQITRSKPDPEVFLRAAQALGFPPARCLVVEDADAGVEAALRGGFPCAGIGPAARNPTSPGRYPPSLSYCKFCRDLLRSAAKGIIL